jgi:hypothetical protein
MVDGLNVRDSRVHAGVECRTPRQARTFSLSGPLRWGLIPHWCKDSARKPINA